MDASERVVDCFSGYTYAQRPRAFTWQGAHYEISAIIGEQHTPKGKKFLVKTTGGELFNLDYTIDLDHWQISPAFLPDNPRRNP